MPVVIKELHVRVNVEESLQDSPAGKRPQQRIDKDALIRECVENVVEIMKREEQR
jgi:hypothetical protein